MALHLTPNMIEGAYNLLRVTKPFNGWKLPDADDVRFIVTRHRTTAGRHYLDREHTIEISASCCGHLDTLTRTVAHEMVHMREADLKVRNDVEHGRVFNQLADQVCRHHGFDRRAF